MKHQLQNLSNSLNTNEFKTITMAEFLSQHTPVTIKEFDGNKRYQHIVYARFYAQYYLRVVKGFKLVEIGKSINKNHATIIHSLKQFKLLTDPIYGDKDYIKLVNYLDEQIKEVNIEL